MESLIICKEILRYYFFASMIFKSLFEDEHLFISWKRSRASVQQLDKVIANVYFVVS